MNYETLRLLRNIFLRSFVVGAAISVSSQIATITFWTAWMNLAVTWFHIDAALFTPVVVWFFTSVKFFLLFILLTPGLALHWTVRCEKKRLEEEDEV
jgi:hypothetical protein